MMRCLVADTPLSWQYLLLSESGDYAASLQEVRATAWNCSRRSLFVFSMRPGMNKRGSRMEGSRAGKGDWGIVMGVASGQIGGEGEKTI